MVRAQADLDVRHVAVILLRSRTPSALRVTTLCLSATVQVGSEVIGHGEIRIQLRYRDKRTWCAHARFTHGSSAPVSAEP